MSLPALRRGTVVTVASPGACAGKPRPAVVVQADRWLQAHPSVTLCPLTSALGKVVGQLEPQLLIELDLVLRGWLELP